jgi:hypothetical protein
MIRKSADRFSDEIIFEMKRLRALRSGLEYGLRKFTSV